MRAKRFTGVRSIAAIIIGVLLLTTVCYGQETLDQTNNPTWTGGAVNIVPVNKVSQTFVPSLPCLVGIEVALKTGNRGRGGDKVTLKILGGSGQQLSSASANIPEGFEGFWRFNLPGGGISVTPGQPITILLQDTNKNVFWWKYKNGNPYPAGSSHFYGALFRDNDFFFRTYGKNTCQSFSLTVTPDPVSLTKGGNQKLTVGVSRQGGFTGAVNISFLNLPSGVSANPATQTISGNSGTSTLLAVTSAASGQFTSTVKGTSGSLTAQKNFQIKIAAPANPHIGGVAPKIQQKGGTIVVSGTNFESNCANNVVTLGGASSTPTICSSTSLTVQVPQQAGYGSTQLMVKSGGRSSNSTAFTVARQFGNFIEITNDIVFQRSTRTCSTGAVRVNVCTPNCPGYVTGSYVAFFKKTSNNASIGSPMTFFKDNPRVGNLGGVGFSLCDIGIVLNANATVSMPQLMSFNFVNLDTGADFQAGPYGFNWVTPAGNASYSPRIFRSPDGTIILVVTPANIGPSQLTAGFIDKVKSGQVINQIGISQVSGTITATITSNDQISFTFGSTTYPPFNIP